MKLRLLKNMYSILSILIIVLGVLILVTPSDFINKLINIIGLVLIFYGLIKALGYFSKDLLQLAYQYDLAFGITLMLIGLVLIFWKNDRNYTISRIISIILIFESLFKIQTSIDGKKVGITFWLPLLILSIISCLIGICFFILSFSQSSLVITFMALGLIVYGIINFLVVRKTVIIKEQE